jgi:hypothetical protein
MFSPLYPWAYGYFRGKQCAVIGFQTYPDNSLHPVVTMFPDGEVLVGNLYDLKMDLKKTKDLTAPDPGDEWKWSE